VANSAPQRASAHAQMSMVGCGVKKGHGFRGPLGCQSVWSPHAVNMDKVRKENDHARDSRMARALHVCRNEKEERMGTASVGVSMVSSPQELAELGSPSKEVSMARVELSSPNDKLPFRCETCSRVFRTKGGLVGFTLLVPTQKRPTALSISSV